MICTLRGGYLTSFTYTYSTEIDKFIEFASLELGVLEKAEVQGYVPTMQFLFTTIDNQPYWNDRSKLEDGLLQWSKVVNMVNLGLVK